MGDTKMNTASILGVQFHAVTKQQAVEHWTHLFRGYQTGLTSFRLDEGLRLLE